MTARCWKPLEAQVSACFSARWQPQDELLQRCQVRLVGACDRVQENYYAISTERKLAQPLVQRSAGVGAAPYTLIRKAGGASA